MQALRSRSITAMTERRLEYSAVMTETTNTAPERAGGHPRSATACAAGQPDVDSALLGAARSWTPVLAVARTRSTRFQGFIGSPRYTTSDAYEARPFRAIAMPMLRNGR
eukprot:scaffold4976_cov131-Isochrysis_galbana.AAC.2